MSKVFLSYNNIISSLGFDSEAVVEKINNEVSGLQIVANEKLFSQPFCSSLIDTKKLNDKFNELNPKKEYTRLEQMMITSLNNSISSSGIQISNRVGLIISTTKGNIDSLDKNNDLSESHFYLSSLGKSVADFFSFENEPIIVSNACVSGILSVAVAKRYIARGTYDNVFIVSGDVVTKFILSGFNSFQAMSDVQCKPYCKNRKGINLGEVAASILVTSTSNLLNNEAVEIIGEGSCNDANHISGPSRTGEGLYRSISSALSQAKITPDKIDYISAHGTATNYNDEMEAIAFNRHGLGGTPVNSLKGYFGHTLGASGLLETIIGMHSLKNKMLYTSLGFDEIGVSQPINVIQKTTHSELNVFLKTASGFGGCNTAILFKKVQNECILE